MMNIFDTALRSFVVAFSLGCLITPLVAEATVTPTRFVFSWDFSPTGGEIQTLVLARQGKDGPWTAQYSTKRSTHGASVETTLISGGNCEFNPLGAVCHDSVQKKLLRVDEDPIGNQRVMITTEESLPNGTVVRTQWGQGLQQIEPTYSFKSWAPTLSLTNGTVEKIWLGTYALNTVWEPKGNCPPVVSIAKGETSQLAVTTSDDPEMGVDWQIDGRNKEDHFRDGLTDSIEQFVFGSSRSEEVSYYPFDDGIHQRFLRVSMSKQRLTKQSRIINRHTFKDKQTRIWEVVKLEDSGISLRAETYDYVAKETNMRTSTKMLCRYSRNDSLDLN